MTFTARSAVVLAAAGATLASLGLGAIVADLVGILAGVGTTAAALGAATTFGAISIELEDEAAAQ
jgi:hypothetical protein